MKSTVKRILAIALIFVLSTFATARASEKLSTTTRPSWHPVSYEEIGLKTRIPEAVRFTKLMKGDHVAYSAEYLFNNRVLRRRAIPVDLYETLIKNFHYQVLTYSTNDLTGCTNEFKHTKANLVSPAREVASVGTYLCLDSDRYARATASAFHQWYRSARAVFDL